MPADPLEFLVRDWSGTNVGERLEPHQNETPLFRCGSRRIRRVGKGAVDDRCTLAKGGLDQALRAAVQICGGESPANWRSRQMAPANDCGCGSGCRGGWSGLYSIAQHLPCLTGLPGPEVESSRGDFSKSPQPSRQSAREIPAGAAVTPGRGVLGCFLWIARRSAFGAPPPSLVDRDQPAGAQRDLLRTFTVAL
jgi:hypothetical protein